MTDVHSSDTQRRGPGRPPNAPKTETETVEPTKPERFIAATESRFQTSAEFDSPLAAYIPETGTPFEHLLRPEYWANIKKLKPRYRIWVEAEDGSYVAELYVQKVGQGYAKVCPLPGYPFVLPGAAGLDAKVADGYEIEFRGNIIKHRIVRLKDGQVIKQGLDTYEEAQTYLREHKRMLAA